jgi:hypothetical protein
VAKTPAVGLEKLCARANPQHAPGGCPDRWTENRSTRFPDRPQGLSWGISGIRSCDAIARSGVSAARKVQFSFTNVTSTVVSPLEAGNYLAAGTLNTQNPVIEHYFKGEESQAFLIVDVLRSDSISVTATDEHGIEVGVDVPAIEGAVGANVKVKPSGTSSGTLTYTGPAPVTFGLIVNEVEYDGNKWSLMGVKPSGDIAFGHSAGTAVREEREKAIPILLGHGCRAH